MTAWASTLLIALLVVPLVGAAATAVLGRGSTSLARAIGLGAVCLNLGFTAALMGQAIGDLIERNAAPVVAADAVTFRPLYETKLDLLTFGTPTSAQPASAIRFHIGLDGLSLWLVALTSLLMVPSVLVSWSSIRDRA